MPAAIMITYFAACIFTAQRLYRAWRPSRVPLCPHQDSPGHNRRCYRRAASGRYLIPIDSDLGATGYAFALSFLWPLVALAWIIRYRAPELAEENQARLKKLDADIAARERELQS